MRILFFFFIVLNYSVFAQIQKSVTLHQPNLLQANAGEDVQIINGTNVQIGGIVSAQFGSPGYTYLWQPSSGLSNSNIANPVASPAQTTSYILSVTDQMGCTDSDTIQITVISSDIESNLFVEGLDVSFDSKSGSFLVLNNSTTNYSNLQISVCNIFGQIVYSSENLGLLVHDCIRIPCARSIWAVYILRIGNKNQILHKKIITN